MRKIAMVGAAAIAALMLMSAIATTTAQAQAALPYKAYGSGLKAGQVVAPSTSVSVDGFVLTTNAAVCNAAAINMGMNPGTATSDGSVAYVLCLHVSYAGSTNDVNDHTTFADVNDTPVSGAVVATSVNLGVLSTGTAKTYSILTDPTGYGITQYRGGGNVAATETVVAAVQAPVEAVATLTINLLAGQATDPVAAADAEFTQSHGALPPPPPEATSPPASASNVARIVSPRLGLDHYIEDIGIVGDTMDTPHDASYAVGWYYTYDLPGVAGNAVFSGHETWDHMQAPFYGLYRAQAGDEIDLEMASGALNHYRVISHHRFDVDTMPMTEILWPSRPEGAQWITLITCGGRLVYDDSGFGKYLDRDVVVAQRVD